jgi:hypothetical protein
MKIKKNLKYYIASVQTYGWGRRLSNGEGWNRLKLAQYLRRSYRKRKSEKLTLLKRGHLNGLFKRNEELS